MENNHCEPLDSSDDEFFDAEDGHEPESDFLFCLNGFPEKFKLINALNIGDLLNSHGTEFEIANLERTNQDHKDSSRRQGIFGNSIAKDMEVDNLDIDISFDEIEKQMDPITNFDGIKRLVLKQGWGAKALLGQTVQIHYMIILEGEDEPTDNSMTRRKPLRFKLGSGSVIPIIDLGTRTMEVNEITKFLATSEFAYGPLGIPPRIPPGVRAMVTIRLLKIIDDSISIREMTSEQRTDLPFVKLFEAALELKDEGNMFFRKQKYDKAMRRYKTGVKILKDMVASDSKEFFKKSETLCVFYSNVAQCHICVERFDGAIEACQLALNLQNVSVFKRRKVYYRYAKAMFASGKAAEAKELIDQSDVGLLDLYDLDVERLYRKIINQIELDKVTSKELARRMFAH